MDYEIETRNERTEYKLIINADINTKFIVSALKKVGKDKFPNEYTLENKKDLDLFNKIPNMHSKIKQLINDAEGLIRRNQEEFIFISYEVKKIEFKKKVLSYNMKIFIEGRCK